MTYVAAGTRNTSDDVGDDEVECVSPAIHWTRLHWAWEMKQDVQDEFWWETR